MRFVSVARYGVNARIPPTKGSSMTNPFYFDPARANNSNAHLAQVLLSGHPSTDEIDTFFKENSNAEERLFGKADIAQDSAVFTIVTEALILEATLHVTGDTDLLKAEIDYNITRHGGVTGVKCTKKLAFGGNRYERKRSEVLESITIDFADALPLTVSLSGTVELLDGVAARLFDHVSKRSE